MIELGFKAFRNLIVIVVYAGVSVVPVEVH